MKSFAWLRNFLETRNLLGSFSRGISIVICIILSIVLLSAIISIITAPEPGYTPTTYKCISCHNDTGYPLDTDNDSVAAPYKRPHNGTVMCETCHDENPHTLTYIQADGSYKGKPTAASCPECHQTGIPAVNNSNFTTAFMIPNPVRHSSDPMNGSLWGNHWTNTSPRSACLYCHDKSLHNVTPLGRILQWSPAYVMKSSIGNGSSCAACHYKGDANWSAMVAAFNSAGLEIPPEITNGTDWNGSSSYFNHSIESYTDNHCKQCHGSLLSRNATMSEFVHSVSGAAGEACIGCHASRTGKDGIYPKIEMASFGAHMNVNRSDGNDTLTNDDCKSCHYDFNYTEMMKENFTTNTRKCTDCHVDGVYPSPIISNHKPPKIANLTSVSAGWGINTSAYCSTCHNSSIRVYDPSLNYSLNATVGHYGTNSSLVKTVNQTLLPRYGFFTPAEASSYNRECNNCHNPPNMSYGTPTSITYAHTSNGTCRQCHINVAADNLHNSSLSLPITFKCKDCHTIYADRFNAPNLTGTDHNSQTKDESCSINCHNFDYGLKGYFDNLTEHNEDWEMVTTSYPTTGTVFLNGETSLTVAKGTQVVITSNISDDYTGYKKASRVRGAEYFIDPNTGFGKGTFMEAADGMFDATNGNLEKITGTIDTSTLSEGNYTVYVRGMDIGKLWSSAKSATLRVRAVGYINGTVTCAGACEGLPVGGASVNVTGGSSTTFTNGFYSISIGEGTYNVTANKRPEYFDNTTSGVIVTSGNTTIVDFILTLKPTGNIAGTVWNASG